jgi:ribosomal protein S17E
MNHKLEGHIKEIVMNVLQYYPDIFLLDIEENNENVQEIRNDRLPNTGEGYQH